MTENHCARSAVLAGHESEEGVAQGGDDSGNGVYPNEHSDGIVADGFHVREHGSAHARLYEHAGGGEEEQEVDGVAVHDGDDDGEKFLLWWIVFLMLSKVWIEFRKLVSIHLIDIGMWKVLRISLWSGTKFLLCYELLKIHSEPRSKHRIPCDLLGVL